MKVVIAGGREFDNYSLLKSRCDYYLQNIEVVEIVSGVVNGADNLGEIYAKERGFKLSKFPVDWNKFKKSAGYIRNEQMAEYADALIAFWDQKSKGTKHMIDLAHKNDLKVKVVIYV